MFLASSFMPARILQFVRQLHNNTLKSAIVTPDKSIMLLPHCNVHALPVDPLRPRRVKMKIFNLQEPLSRDTGDQPINKYTTFNMEMSHTQEHPPFARENPNPCKLAPYGITHDFYQQYSGIQRSATHREQERSTPACSLTKKHQTGTIAERGEQNYGQTKHMPGNTKIQQPRFKRDTVPMVNLRRAKEITAPKANSRNTCRPVFSHAVRTGGEATQDLPACENIIVLSHYTTEYRRRRLNDRTERQDHDNDNSDGNDSFQDNDNDNAHLNDNDNFDDNYNFDDNDNENAHPNDNNNFNDNDNFDGNDVNDNDNLDVNESIVTESEQEYFLNFSSNDQRNQEGGAAGRFEKMKMVDARKLSGGNPEIQEHRSRVP